ncbi:hypothetical protein RC62_4023 [Flavobacterium aquidurense]|uniref:Uncharacterized protein n=1 Tax=Flavobacterium aquidurense TaxID=362413 RepID=A0A0Q1BLF7_9FLAO|nr:hypothetical protein RC62_4023 [Flavobacterium aquidurense]
MQNSENHKNENLTIAPIFYYLTDNHCTRKFTTTKSGHQN